MSTFKKYFPIVSLVILVTIVSIFVGIFFSDFFKSGAFVALITFIVGLFGIWLYIKRKEDFKRDAAGTLLMEIRYAERIINGLRNNLPKFDPWVTILPASNWSNYSYLFTDDLDQDELDLINNFYNDCSVVEKGASLLDVGTQLYQKGNHIQSTLANLAKSASSPDDYLEKKNKFIKIIERETYIFSPKLPQEKIVSVLGKIKDITTSTAGNKLKRIAGQSKRY